MIGSEVVLGALVAPPPPELSVPHAPTAAAMTNAPELPTPARNNARLDMINAI
ncbi:MAG: hypothetical protein ACRD12_13515 [Acidimicrobiales bacterium]